MKHTDSARRFSILPWPKGAKGGKSGTCMAGCTMLLLLLLLCSPSGLLARPRSLRVAIPGTLPSLVGESRKYTLTALSIEGRLNGTDLRFLREMAGRDYHRQSTAGRLRTLDLSRAIFAPGGEAYIDKDGPRHVTGSPLTLPPFAFRECLLEKIVLPERMDTLGTGAFEYSALRSIRIPEGSVVMGWAFNRCENLEKVEMPQHLAELGQNCFRDCGSLGSLRFHDVEYLPYHAFEEATGLEEIVVDGTLLHVDGWFCHSCPRLRRIEFAGVVLTTGGQPIASRCPQLREIIFSGISLPMGFGSVEDCPLMERCSVTGYVMRSADEQFIPYSHSIGNVSPGRVRELLQGMSKYFESSRLKNAWSSRLFDRGNIAYNLACILALKGLKDEALEMLGKSVEQGYAQYRHARQDSDLDILHGDARFLRLLGQMEETWKREYDYLNVLRHAPAYASRPLADAPAFTYAPPSDPDLLRVRQYFRLDSIAGGGDEISQMKRIMYWLHDEIPHDGSGGFPDHTPRNAIDLHKACKARERGLNCRGLALVLSEMYLAMGWPARAITCQPRRYSSDPDCHVITVVWSRDLQKWVWMDPSFAAFVTDENGLLLHPGEVRQRLIDGRPLVLNEDANWNHRSRQTKEEYLENYMAKNLYYLSAYLHGRFGVETPDRNREDYYTLAPEGTEAPNRPALSDEAWFWQAPAE